MEWKEKIELNGRIESKEINKTVKISCIYLFSNQYLNVFFPRPEITKTFHEANIYSVPGDGLV